MERARKWLRRNMQLIFMTVLAVYSMCIFIQSAMVYIGATEKASITTAATTEATTQETIETTTETTTEATTETTTITTTVLTTIETTTLTTTVVTETTTKEVVSESQSYMGEFKLTFYAPTGNLTSTGTIPVEGRTIAVDPNVIPYGSTVYIDGWGEFIAEDCGGNIKGQRIDVFMNSEQKCSEYGVQRASVYIVR